MLFSVVPSSAPLSHWRIDSSVLSIHSFRGNTSIQLTVGYTESFHSAFSQVFYLSYYVTVECPRE